MQEQKDEVDDAMKLSGYIHGLILISKSMTFLYNSSGRNRVSKRAASTEADTSC